MSSGLNLFPQTSSPATLLDPKKSKRKRGVIALLLSILQPGLGQIYNGEPAKAIVYYLFWGALLVLCRALGVWNRFPGFVVFITLSGGTSLYMIIQATRAGFQQKLESKSPQGSRVTAIVAIALAIVVFIANGSGFIFDRVIAIRGFTTPSVSMSPTIRLGDRIVANMQTYNKTPPNRGDVVLFLFAPTDAMLVKRVAGIAGDTIEIHQDKVIRNGVPLQEPYLLPPDPADDSSGSESGPKTVPEGEFYLIGDNRRNSYDSRSFGTVNLSQIRGKALFVYWSTDPSRIGRPIQ
jgi:signal peptidase I